MLSELRARWTERDLVSGLHQGQRPSGPRQQAGKMTAPDRSSAKSYFTLAEQGPSKDDSTHAMGLEDRKPLAGNVNRYAKGGKVPLTLYQTVAQR